MAETDTDALARRALGRSLWSASMQAKTDLTPEQRKQSWEEHKGHYVKHANKLMQSLEKRGFKIVKS